MKEEISRFGVGGVYDDRGKYLGGSLPDGIFQRAFGTTINLNVAEQTAEVPTDEGLKYAQRGDSIVAYSDGTFDVEYAKWK